LMRDSRIAQLYEGTNGIQAADLISRKLARDNGVTLQATQSLLQKWVSDIQLPSSQAFAQDLLNEWVGTSQQLIHLNAVDLAGSAYDYMHYSAYCILGILWLSMADRAQQSSIESLKSGKANTCAFYLKRLLPRKDGFKLNLLSGANDLLALADHEFDYQ